jgi:hypothetical protein
VPVRVTKVVFAIDGKTAQTVRSAPFRARFTVAPTATAGSTLELHAEAYLRIRGGKHRTKSITVAARRVEPEPLSLTLGIESRSVRNPPSCRRLPMGPAGLEPAT